MFAGEPVELEVAARPLLVGVGHVHRGGELGTAGSRVDAGAARVRKEVEEGLARGKLAQQLAGVAVVEEETRVQAIA